MHLMAKQARQHLSLKYASNDMSRTNAFKRAQVPGSSRSQKTKTPNFILLCLELLLPVYDGLVAPEDKPLLDMCTARLGMVRSFNNHVANYLAVTIENSYNMYSYWLGPITSHCL